MLHKYEKSAVLSESTAGYQFKKKLSSTADELRIYFRVMKGLSDRHFGGLKT